MSNLMAPSSAASRRPFPCGQCNKAFTSSHQLTQHSRVHTGEKPYKCSFCERKFKQLSHVQQHTRLHTGERPYKCSAPNCGRSFIQLSNLQQHFKTHLSLTKEAEKKFFCDQCGKGLKSQSSLFSHQCKKHGNISDSPNMPKFICKLCGKNYSSEGSFKKHIENHQANNTNNNNNSNSNNNNNNNNVPSNAIPPGVFQLFRCNACGFQFSSEFALISHYEQMRMDPKHKLETQMILSHCSANEGKHGGENLNMLSGNLNGDSDESDTAAVATAASVQALLQMNLAVDDGASPLASQCRNRPNRTNGNEANMKEEPDFGTHSEEDSGQIF